MLVTCFPLTSIVWTKIKWSKMFSWEKKLFGYQHSSKYHLCVHQKSVIQVWNNMRESKLGLSFCFWVNYPSASVQNEMNIHMPPMQGFF